MGNTNKNSTMNLYQHLTKYIAHFVQHKPTQMAQFMKAKLTPKESGMAVA